MNLTKLQTGTDLEVYHIGPPLEQGPLPTLFYFALSAEDSLSLPLISHPATYLAEKGLRVISITLPEHGQGLNNDTAMERWKKSFSENSNLFEQFIDTCKLVVETLTETIIDPSNLQVAGLSRGGFVAFHLAAKMPNIHSILGFSPATDLLYLGEFESNDHIPSSLSHLADKLVDRRIKLFIGNNDTQVGTSNCFSFLQTIVNESIKQKNHQLPYEMTIFPSQGRHGHGTPPHIFEQGCNWLLLKK